LQKVWRMLGTSDGCAASSLAPPRGWRLDASGNAPIYYSSISVIL
jgi:hypothetical protein